MKLTAPNNHVIAENESLVTLKNRMIVREGKSEETLRRYLDGVLRFTEYMKAESPDAALKAFAESADRTQKLDGFVDYLLNKGKKPINVKALWQGVKKWLVSNRVNNIDYDYISRPKCSSQIQDRIPTVDELRLILENKVMLRDKAFFLLAAASGLRLGTLITLQVKDYKPVEELGMITVEGGEGRKLAKGKSYFTFITPETRRILEDYLKTRGPLTPDAPLFAKPNGEAVTEYVYSISRQWRILVNRAKLLHKIPGHTWIELHGHTLRKFFQTHCKLAGCRADFVDGWMGHHPTGKSEYLNDSYFRPDLNAHLSEYRKAVSSLSVFEDAKQVKLEKETEGMKAKIQSLEGTVDTMVKMMQAVWQGKGEPVTVTNPPAGLTDVQAWKFKDEDLMQIFNLSPEKLKGMKEKLKQLQSQQVKT